MRVVGIVGHEATKFTAKTRAGALYVIRTILDGADKGVSGACPLGGIDVWAKQVADAMGKAFEEFPPKTNDWENGFKPRNLLIARAATEVHVIAVDTYPESYRGRRFTSCYHCGVSDHIKGGACWTAKQALRMGRRACWHIITPSGLVVLKGWAEPTGLELAD